VRRRITDLGLVDHHRSRVVGGLWFLGGIE
jgi:hypothetical protein